MPEGGSPHPGMWLCGLCCSPRVLVVPGKATRHSGTPDVAQNQPDHHCCQGLARYEEVIGGGALGGQAEIAAGHRCSQLLCGGFSATLQEVGTRARWEVPSVSPQPYF